jgi:hypothetical protein
VSVLLVTCLVLAVVVVGVIGGLLVQRARSTARPSQPSSARIGRKSTPRVSWRGPRF